MVDELKEIGVGMPGDAFTGKADVNSYRKLSSILDPPSTGK